MLVVEGLTCRFGTKAAVDNASFSIAPGGFVGVIGRSGAGKSTLLRMINRLAEPSEGRILFEGVDVTALRGRDLRQWRARSAMIFQQFNLVGRLDVLTNVLMGRLAEIPSWRSLTQLWPDEDRALAMSALEQFDMASFAAQRADQLSGGQQQRVAIARALVQNPEIILADEPIASLDPRNTKVVMDALLRINKHFGITVICNLHSLDLARTYCDRLIGMSAGRVVFDGAPAMLTDQIARELYDLEANEVMGAASGAGACRFDHSGSRHRRRGLSTCVQSSVRTAAYRSRTTSASEKRGCHDQPSYDSRQCRGAGLHGYRSFGAGLEGQISRTDLCRRAGRERLRRDRALDPVRHYLSKELGVKVNLRIANDYAAVIEGQRAGNIHIASYGSASFARARLTGVKTDAFANDINSDGSTGYYSVFFVKASSPYKSVDQLKGKNLGLVDPNSTSGNNVPRFELDKLGISDADAYFGKVVFTGSHENAILALTQGTVDVAANQWTTDDDSTLAQMLHKGMLKNADGTPMKKDDFRIIHKSAPILNGPYAYSSELPDDLKAAIAKAFADARPRTRPRSIACPTARRRLSIPPRPRIGTARST